MERNALHIRPAVPEDAEKLLQIYEPYILKTAITYEYEIPSVEEFRGRMENTLKRFPYYVAERDGEILGYAYASPFHPRKAYEWSAESSIYVAMDHHGEGVGRLLYDKLEETLKLQGIRNLNACIACTDREDEYLTNASTRFHAHMGYRMVGIFHQCAYKFGRWYDMCWMEKILADHPAQIEDITLFPELKDEEKEKNHE